MEHHRTLLQLMCNLCHLHYLKLLSGIYIYQGQTFSCVLNVQNNLKKAISDGKQFRPCQASHSCLGIVEQLCLSCQFMLEDGMALFVHAPHKKKRQNKCILMHVEVLQRIRRCQHITGILSVPQHHATIQKVPTTPRAVSSSQKEKEDKYPQVSLQTMERSLLWVHRIVLPKFTGGYSLNYELEVPPSEGLINSDTV